MTKRHILDECYSREDLTWALGGPGEVAFEVGEKPLDSTVLCNGGEGLIIGWRIGLRYMVSGSLHAQLL